MEDAYEAIRDELIEIRDLIDDIPQEDVINACNRIQELIWEINEKLGD